MVNFTELDNTPKIYVPKTKKAQNKLILRLLGEINEKIEYLFTHQIKFDTNYFYGMNINKLQVLCIVLRKEAIDVKLLPERKRRLLLYKLIKKMKIKRFTYDELIQLRIALGYPKPKTTKFKTHVREAVHDLIRELLNDLGRDYRKKSLRFDKEIDRWLKSLANLITK